jgi:hypothetical protein
MHLVGDQSQGDRRRVANVKVIQRMLGYAMTLDLHGHLLDDDLFGVADVLGEAIEGTAVSVRYSDPLPKASQGDIGR